jgi:hypothetical protein
MHITAGYFGVQDTAGCFRVKQETEVYRRIMQDTVRYSRMQTDESEGGRLLQDTVQQVAAGCSRIQQGALG